LASNHLAPEKQLSLFVIGILAHCILRSEICDPLSQTHPTSTTPRQHTLPRAESARKIVTSQPQAVLPQTVKIKRHHFATQDMATRFSARIAAAEARLRTGNAKATRSSDRIAKMNKLSERDELQQATAGGRVQKPGGRQSRIKKSSATRASRAERGNEQRFRDTNDPASPTAVLNGPGSHRPAYYGGPQIEFWNGNLPPDAEDLDDSGVHDQPENDAPDDVDPDPDPHTEANRIGPFLQILFNGVTTQRALRRKCNELRKCCQDVRDADFRITQYRQVAAFRNPATDEDWNMHNALLLRITEWEARS
jgi:hypothetical protein